MVLMQTSETGIVVKVAAINRRRGDSATCVIYYMHASNIGLDFIHFKVQSGSGFYQHPKNTLSVMKFDFECLHFNAGLPRILIAWFHTERLFKYV